MPLTKKGASILASMQHQYGTKKGTSVFYASRHAGKITGVERKTDHGFYGHCDPATMGVRGQVDTSVELI